MSTKKSNVYKCEKCGNIVEVLQGGEGNLFCCGEEMTFFAENTKDAAKEKHVPIVEKIPEGYRVKVGEIEHPMTEEHYIEFIELITEKDTLRAFLKPGDKPEAVFKTEATSIKVREYCNLHGLWSVNVL